MHRFETAFRAANPWLPGALATRLVHSYGTRAETLLDGARSLEELGPHFGDGLYAAEVRYLTQNEWARTADDILWRRSKLALHVSRETRENLKAWLDHPEQESYSA